MLSFFDIQSPSKNNSCSSTNSPRKLFAILLFFECSWLCGSITFSIVLWFVQRNEILRDTASGKFMQMISLYGIVNGFWSLFLSAAKFGFNVSSYTPFVNFVRVAEFIAFGSNMGFIWVLMTHTVLKSILLRMYFTPYNPSLFAKLSLGSSIFYFLLFSCLQPLFHLYKDFGECVDFDKKEIVSFFFVHNNRFVLSLFERGYLMGVPTVILLLNAIFLLYYVGQVTDHTGRCVITRKSILYNHILPGLLCGVYIALSLHLERLHFHRKSLVHGKFFTLRENVTDVLKLFVQSIFNLSVSLCFCLDLYYGKNSIFPNDLISYIFILVRFFFR